MILEIAEIQIRPNCEAAFEAAVSQAVPLFQRAKGCISMQLQKSLEHANSYMLVVGWQTVEHHTVDFRGSNDFYEWRRLVGEYFLQPPKVQHMQSALQGF